MSHCQQQHAKHNVRNSEKRKNDPPSKLASHKNMHSAKRNKANHGCAEWLLLWQVMSAHEDHESMPTTTRYTCTLPAWLSEAWLGHYEALPSTHPWTHILGKACISSMWTPREQKDPDLCFTLGSRNCLNGAWNKHNGGRRSASDKG